MGILQRSNPILAELGGNTLVQLEGIGKRKELAAGETLIHEGEKADEFFIILSGEVSILKRASQENQQGYHFATLSEGDIVGELALIDDAPRSASVEALTDLSVLAFDVQKIKTDPNLRGLYNALIESVGKKTAKRLRSTNNITVAALERELGQAKKRIALGVFTVNLLALMLIYGFALSGIKQLKFYFNANLPLSVSMLIIVAVVFYYAMRKSQYPFSMYGLTLDNWKQHTIESILWTLPFMLLILGLKWVFITFSPEFQHEPLFHPTSIFVDESNVSWALYFAFMWSYILICPVQEFIARAGIQTAFQQFLASGRWPAIFLSNGVFAYSHLHTSMGLALTVFIPGLFWGWMFAKQKTLVGPTISHILIGVWAMFIVGIDDMFLSILEAFN